MTGHHNPAWGGSQAHAFGRRLARCRANAGLTQTEVASAVGLSRSAIANIEAGRAGTGLGTVVWMAALYAVDPGWLLVGDTDAPPLSAAAHRLIESALHDLAAQATTLAVKVNAMMEGDW